MSVGGARGGSRERSGDPKRPPPRAAPRRRAQRVPSSRPRSHFPCLPILSVNHSFWSRGPHAAAPGAPSVPRGAAPPARPLPGAVRCSAPAARAVAAASGRLGLGECGAAVAGGDGHACPCPEARGVQRGGRWEGRRAPRPFWALFGGPGLPAPRGAAACRLAASAVSLVYRPPSVCIRLSGPGRGAGAMPSCHRVGLRAPRLRGQPGRGLRAGVGSGQPGPSDSGGCFQPFSIRHFIHRPRCRVAPELEIRILRSFDSLSLATVIYPRRSRGGEAAQRPGSRGPGGSRTAGRGGAAGGGARPVRSLPEPGRGPFGPFAAAGRRCSSHLPSLPPQEAAGCSGGAGSCSGSPPPGDNESHMDGGEKDPMGDGCSAVDVPVATLSGHHTRLLRDGHGGGAWRRRAVTTALGRAAPGKAWKSRAHLHGDTSEC